VRAPTKTAAPARTDPATFTDEAAPGTEDEEGDVLLLDDELAEVMVLFPEA